MHLYKFLRNSLDNSQEVTNRNVEENVIRRKSIFSFTTNKTHFNCDRLLQTLCVCMRQLHDTKDVYKVYL